MMEVKVKKAKNKELDNHEKEQGIHRERGTRQWVLTLFGLMVVTGLAAVAYGYRDAMVVGTITTAFVIGVILAIKLKRNPNRPPPKGVRKWVRIVFIGLMILISLFSSTDHVRLALLGAEVQRKTDDYTTIQRCQLLNENQVCMHESGDKVILYYFTHGEITSTEDITDTVDKYKEEGTGGTKK